MLTIAQIKVLAAVLSDAEIMDHIAQMTETLDGMTYQEQATRGGGAESLKIARAGLYAVLDARYPWLDPILETWLNDDNDTRPMLQVYADALAAEYVLV